jgi:hypothetical protein
MGRLVFTFMLLGSMSAFGQLLAVDGFKKNKHGLYEMSFKNIRDAVRKYNYVSDMNGADTNDVVFDIMKNPIDFAFFGNNIESQIVSLMIVDGDRYKIMFGEFDGSEDKDFFTVISEKNRPLNLIYRVK